MRQLSRLGRPAPRRRAVSVRTPGRQYRRRPGVSSFSHLLDIAGVDSIVLGQSRKTRGTVRGRVLERYPVDCWRPPESASAGSVRDRARAKMATSAGGPPIALHGLNGGQPHSSSIRSTRSARSRRAASPQGDIEFEVPGNDRRIWTSRAPTCRDGQAREIRCDVIAGAFGHKWCVATGIPAGHPHGALRATIRWMVRILGEAPPCRTSPSMRTAREARHGSNAHAGNPSACTDGPPDDDVDDCRTGALERARGKVSADDGHELGARRILQKGVTPCWQQLRTSTLQHRRLFPRRRTRPHRPPRVPRGCTSRSRRGSPCSRAI